MFRMDLSWRAFWRRELQRLCGVVGVSLCCLFAVLLGSGGAARKLQGGVDRRLFLALGRRSQ